MTPSHPVLASSVANISGTTGQYGSFTSGSSSLGLRSFIPEVREMNKMTMGESGLYARKNTPANIPQESTSLSYGGLQI